MAEIAKLEGDGIEEALLAYVAAEVAAAPEGLTREEKLVESGRVDSLGLLQLLAHVEEHFGVNLLAAGGPADLESIAAIARAIRRERARREARAEAS